MLKLESQTLPPIKNNLYFHLNIWFFYGQKNVKEREFYYIHNLSFPLARESTLLQGWIPACAGMTRQSSVDYLILVPKHHYLSWSEIVAFSNMRFLFMDESFYEPLDLASLTGVLVPIATYREVRDELCLLAWEALAAEPNVVPQPIELHSRNLLSELVNVPSNELDQRRLRIFSEVVRIVNDHQLEVIRTAYLNRTEIAKAMVGDSKLYGINFFNFQSSLRELMKDTLVVPIMDGVPSTTPSAKKAPAIDLSLIRAFAASVRMTHQIRMSDAASMLSIENVFNLGEPLFGDSTHSTLLQLADLVSYLLLQRDRAIYEQSEKTSEFRSSVLEIAHCFESKLISSWTGKLEHSDTP